MAECKRIKNMLLLNRIRKSFSNFMYPINPIIVHLSCVSLNTLTYADSLEVFEFLKQTIVKNKLNEHLEMSLINLDLKSNDVSYKNCINIF